MSGESELHVRLVEKLIATIMEQHANPRGMILLADHHGYGSDRPFQIDRYTPDIYASDAPATFRVIGEAKTPNDLQTDRSRRQLVAFLDHLSLYTRSSLYLAVPWFICAQARCIIKAARKPSHVGVTTVVVSLSSGARC